MSEKRTVPCPKLVAQCGNLQYPNSQIEKPSNPTKPTNPGSKTDSCSKTVEPVKAKQNPSDGCSQRPCSREMSSNKQEPCAFTVNPSDPCAPMPNQNNRCPQKQNSSNFCERKRNPGTLSSNSPVQYHRTTNYNDKCPQKAGPPERGRNYDNCSHRVSFDGFQPKSLHGDQFIIKPSSSNVYEKKKGPFGQGLSSNLRCEPNENPNVPCPYKPLPGNPQSHKPLSDDSSERRHLPCSPKTNLNDRYPQEPNPCGFYMKRQYPCPPNSNQCPPKTNNDQCPPKTNNDQCPPKTTNDQCPQKADNDQCPPKTNNDQYPQMPNLKDYNESKLDSVTSNQSKPRTSANDGCPLHPSPSALNENNRGPSVQRQNYSDRSAPRTNCSNRCG